MPARHKALTQPSTSRGRGSRNGRLTKSQISIEESLYNSDSDKSLEEYANKCVRYVLSRSAAKLPIRKTDLQKNVTLGSGRKFEAIISTANKVLNRIYGYDMYSVEEPTSTKYYLLRNSLPFKSSLEFDTDNGDNNSQPKVEEYQKIVVMLVLIHVYMTNALVSEGSIFSFLTNVGIDSSENHNLFGNVHELVTSTMVKRKYLSTNSENKDVLMYLWGPRAEKEISKMELLKFVCEVYKDRCPEAFADLFEPDRIMEICEDIEEESDDSDD